MNFKVGDRVLAKPIWLETWELETIVRIPGYDGNASVRLDCHKTYNSSTDTPSIDFHCMRHLSKLEKYLYGELDTTHQNE